MSLFKKPNSPKEALPTLADLEAAGSFKDHYPIPGPLSRARIFREAAMRLDFDVEGYYKLMPVDDVPFVALSQVMRTGGRYSLDEYTTALALDLPGDIGRSLTAIAKTFRLTADKISRRSPWTDEQRSKASATMAEVWRTTRRERYGPSGLSPDSAQYHSKERREEVKRIIAAMNEQRVRMLRQPESNVA